MPTAAESGAVVASGPVGTWQGSLLNPPNLISLARVPLAVAFLLVSSTGARVAIIVAAGASDYLDGWWARTRGPRTRLGEVLDPITDKLFVVTALVAFAVWRVIGPAELLVLLARDLFVVAGVGVITALRAPVRPRARFPGKLVTTLQIVAVLALTLVPQYARSIVLATAAASLWAITDYTLAAAREWRHNRRELRLRPPQRPR